MIDAAEGSHGFSKLSLNICTYVRISFFKSWNRVLSLCRSNMKFLSILFISFCYGSASDLEAFDDTILFKINWPRGDEKLLVSDFVFLEYLIRT